MLTAFMTLYNGQPTPIARQASLIAPLFIVIVSSVYALLKVPVLTNQVFSGAAGLSSGGLVERTFK